MKLLIHACCGPCSTYTYESLKGYHKIVLFWYNPNIHPFREYQKRLDSFKKFVYTKDVEHLIDEDYTLKDFLKGALKEDNRCFYCYKLRLHETAKKASENGYDGFSTTLTISPYQDHDIIRKIGTELEGLYQVDFVYEDMTNGFRQSQDMARDMELYMQGYCGCIFSEADRYKK